MHAKPPSVDAPPEPPPLPRCAWCEGSDLERAYHDAEWGVPVRDDRALFELLTLEGAQAGLSWRTVLAKREGYREAFAGFEPARVARLRARHIDAMLRNPGVVRHRGKLESVVGNAQALLGVQHEHGSFAAFVWAFVAGTPLQPARRAGTLLPALTAESTALSRALAGRGFRFVGPTICYAFMQAAGLVNDHVVTCHRHAPLATAGPPASSSGSRAATGRRRPAASSR
jgi:DNA-3-methyladenine glycosylase I